MTYNVFGGTLNLVQQQLDLQSLATYGHELLTCKISSSTVSRFRRQIGNKRTNAQTDGGDCITCRINAVVNMRRLCVQVTDVIRCKTDCRQVSKYRQYVDEVDRATRLLLLLAGRLARLDNSALATPSDSQPITPVFSSFLPRCAMLVRYMLRPCVYDFCVHLSQVGVLLQVCYMKVRVTPKNKDTSVWNCAPNARLR